MMTLPFKNMSKGTAFILPACLLLLTRMVYTGQITFAFLIWNLMLAWIPFRLMQWLYNNPQVTGLGRWSIFGVWLIFLPNAPYLITDLIHLKLSTFPLVWLDLMMIFLFSLSGLYFGFESLHIAVKIMQQHWGKMYANIASTLVLFSCGFGIYLGRIVRFNSWDLLLHPWTISHEIMSIYLDIDKGLFPWAFSLLTGIVLFVLYHQLYKPAAYENAESF